MKDKYTANEFRELIKNGGLETSGRRIKSSGQKLSNFVDQEVSKKELMFPESEYIFISGQVYSSKNTQSIRIKGIGNPSNWKCKIKGAWQFVTPFVSKNDNALNYAKRTAIQYKMAKDRFLSMLEGKSKPYIVEFIFVMPTKAQWDFNNICQGVQDCMVDAGMIEDDNVYNLLPTFPRSPNRAFYVDKDNPGVYFKVLNK